MASTVHQTLGGGSFDTRATTGMATAAPSAVVLGGGLFKGKVDELKVFKGRMSTADIVAGRVPSSCL